MGGGEAVWDLLTEIKDIVSKAEASNDPAFGTTGAKLRDAIESVERSSKWLLEKIATSPAEALAGATPYLRLFSTTLGGCSLANEALAARKDDSVQGDAGRYVTLARFFAENVTVQSGAFERTIMDAATASTGADAVLTA
jgi:butyryl-CoA dehydrogenase